MRSHPPLDVVRRRATRPTDRWPELPQANQSVKLNIVISRRNVIGPGEFVAFARRIGQ